MKKTIISLVAALAAVPVLLMANSDRIEIKNGSRIEKIWVNEVEEMVVMKDAGGADGFDRLNVRYKSGDDKIFQIADIKSMKWVNGLQPSTLALEAVPHHRSITLNVDCPNPETTYSFGAMPMEYLEGLNENEWHEAILQYERKLVEDYAAALEKDVKDLDPNVIFAYKGKNKITWWPSTVDEYNAMPGKNYVAYAFEGTINENGLVLDHDVKMQKVTAKTVSLADTDYEITYDVDPSYLTAKVTSSDNEPFLIFLIPELDCDPSNPDGTAIAQIATFERALYNYGDGDWDNATHIGSGTKKSGQLLSGNSYYILAVGCEYGTMTTHAVVSEKITIPYPSVVDNCTFNVSATPVTASEIKLTIKPSNPATHYVTFVREAGVVQNPLEYLTRNIYGAMQRNVLSPELSDDNPYVFSGEQTINSLKNCFDGTPMMVGKEYVYYTVGIDEKGTPTTAVNEFHYIPEAQEGRMWFDITFHTDTYPTSGTSTRALYYCITPSDLNMKYVFDKRPFSEKDLEKTDEEFMRDYVESQGKYLYMYTYQGVRDLWTNFDQKFNSTTEEWEFQPYLIFVFGYDGAPTSDLYLYKFDSDTGELTQLRGPGVN